MNLKINVKIDSQQKQTCPLTMIFYHKIYKKSKAF